MHIEREASVRLAGDKLRIVPGAPVRIESSLLDNPLGLPQVDIDRFLNSALPLAVPNLVQVQKAIQLPSLSGLNSSHHELRVFQDAPGGDYLTIER